METGERVGDPCELNINSQFETIEDAEKAILHFCGKYSHPVKRESAQSAQSYNKRLTNPLPPNIKIFTIRWACRYYGCRRSRSRKQRSSLKIRRLLTPRGCRFHITVRYDRVVSKFRITSCHLTHNHTLVLTKQHSSPVEGCSDSSARPPPSAEHVTNHLAMDGHDLPNGQSASRPSTANGLRVGIKRGSSVLNTIVADDQPKMSISEGWNQESNRTLCDIMFELKEEEWSTVAHIEARSSATTPSLPDSLFWVKASLKMTDRGFLFSSTFLRERWKQLTDRYQRVRCRTDGGANDDNAADEDSASSTWELYPTLDAFHHVVNKRRRRQQPSSPASPRQQQMLPFVTCSLLDESVATAHSEDRSSSSGDEYSAAAGGADSDDWDNQHLVIDEGAGVDQDEPVDSKEWFAKASQRLVDSERLSTPRTSATTSNRTEAEASYHGQADDSVPPAWFARSMAEMEDRLEQRLNRALEKHTNIVQEMHGTLKELLIRCGYTKGRPS